eukprot:340713_1
MAQPESNDAWLGLLKWSLNYVDGTVPSSESPSFTQMSAEDKAFLEEVMKNGIIDEGQRMKTILSSLVAYLDDILLRNKKKINNDFTAASRDEDFVNSKSENLITENEALELLQELQDIVEQIDYARSFAAMGGIEFLIGCSDQRGIVSSAIRSASLAVLFTLNQNNPPVQYMMLEQGSIVKLLNLYFAEFPPQQQQQQQQDGDGNVPENEDDIEVVDTSLRSKIVQAMASSVRNHDTAEQIFCMNADGIKMIESGLGLHFENETLPCPNLALKRKTLFFLQALVTSDSADAERVRMFTRAIQYAACNFLDPEKEGSQEIREMTLTMLLRILDRKQCVNSVLNMKSILVSVGVRRVAALRTLDGEEKEYIAEELNLWESLITDIARTPRDEVATVPPQEPTMMIGGTQNGDSNETTPQ